MVKDMQGDELKRARALLVEALALIDTAGFAVAAAHLEHVVDLLDGRIAGVSDPSPD